jgi:hypothetical protein
MKAHNATLIYRLKGGRVQQFNLWVMRLEQPHMLTGATYQSRTKRHFYPRSYAPGDITVGGRLPHEESLQNLSLYIRKHQRAVLNVPNAERFARVNPKAPGFQRLMRLSIPSENILVRGWIPDFSITKKGVFNVAPEFSFNFFVVFDNTARDIGISHRIKKYYDQNDYAKVAAATRQLEKDDFDPVDSDQYDPDRRGGR